MWNESDKEVYKKTYWQEYDANLFLVGMSYNFHNFPVSLFKYICGGDIWPN